MKRQTATRHTGQSTTEYGLVLGLVAVLVIVALVAVNAGVGGVFSSVSYRIQAVVSGGVSGTTPTAAVEPSVQTVGQTVTVTGSGYTPNSSVTITLHSTPVILGTTTSDSAGDVGPVSVAIPDGTDTTVTHVITLSTPTQTGVSNDLTVNAPACAGSMICGTVVDASGAAVAGERIGAIPSGQPGSSLRTYTDSQGNYALPVSAGTSYQVTACAGGYTGGNQICLGYTSTEPTADVVQSSLVPVGSEPATGIDFRLPVFYTVSGTVTSASGTPVPGEIVDAMLTPFADGSEAAAATQTDAQGRYSFSGAWSLIAGSYYITLTQQPSGPTSQMGPVYGYTSSGLVGFASLSNLTPVVVSTSSIANFNLQLPATHAISGTITSASGDLSGWQVTVESSNGSAGIDASLTLGSSGNYSVAVPDGTYVVVVHDPQSPSAYFYSTSGAQTDPSLATQVAVSGTPVSAIDLEIP